MLDTQNRPRRKGLSVKQERPFAVIGWREWVRFPDFDNVKIKAKIDTGARTSALHAWKIKPYEQDGQTWVKFELHPLQKSQKSSVHCKALVSDIKTVKSSSGHTEDRYTVVTDVAVGPYRFPIELTLTNRDDMGFRMLLGRAAIKNRFLVECAHSFIQSPVE